MTRRCSQLYMSSLPRYCDNHTHMIRTNNGVPGFNRVNPVQYGAQQRCPEKEGALKNIREQQNYVKCLGFSQETVEEHEILSTTRALKWKTESSQKKKGVLRKANGVLRANKIL